MDWNTVIPIGAAREETFLVEEQHTAYHIGSGDARVLATPWMISFMERVANRLLDTYLPEGYLSVGIHVDVKHLAPTPLHTNVHVQAEVLEVKGNRVLFRVSVRDALELLGEGTHWRAIVERERYMRRALAKSIQQGSSE
jgi:predicted thioesterase